MENSADETEYEDVYTNHFVTVPPLLYRRWGFWRLMKKVKRRMAKEDIQMGEPFSLYGVPYITFTSRCDNELDLDEFRGRLSFGNYVRLVSLDDYYPLHCGPVRITLVKTKKDLIGEIRIGNNVHLAGTIIVSYNKVTIGNDVLFGPNVTIMDCSGHALKGRGERGELDRLKTAPIEIADGAWLGQGACVLKGVRIGKNSVVGINAVVHESVPDNTVVAGNPARIIKTLD
ncbi:MAG: acyltransferase [Spirochaetales bacterium]|nr:acyltransferase [Spirochaetales bacterium]